MKYLLLMFIPILTFGAPTKYLIENSMGKQSVEVVDPVRGGGFAPDVVIIWDESKHGTLPAVNANDMGGYSKSGSTLIVNRSKADTEKAKLDAITDLRDRIVTLKAKAADKDITLDEMMELLSKM